MSVVRVHPPLPTPPNLRRVGREGSDGRKSPSGDAGHGIAAAALCGVERFVGAPQEVVGVLVGRPLRDSAADRDV